MDRVSQLQELVDSLSDFMIRLFDRLSPMHHPSDPNAAMQGAKLKETQFKRISFSLCRYFRFL